MNLAFEYKSISKDDIFISKLKIFDFETKVEIEILIVPLNDENKESSSFDENWSLAFGDSISINLENDNEYFAFKTEIFYDVDRNTYINKKMIISTWNDIGDSLCGRNISRSVLESISTYLVDAQRDIFKDIRDKKSAWSRATSEINITSENRSKIQKNLDTVNKNIVKNSSILKIMKKNLQYATADENSIVEISPITKDIESLYKGMNIYYGSKDTLPISVENLGMGIRSWAVFSSIKTSLNIQADKFEDDRVAFYPLLLVEEPETHVHPQAQRQLFSDIKNVVGQKIITTHSPYILSQVDLEKIMYVKLIDGKTEITSLLIDDLTPEEIRKIKRTVMNTRGEILYSNAVIFAEGETEEQALNIFLEEYFSKEAFELGVSVVGVGGGNYLPFIRMMHKLNIPWYIFSDAEEGPLKTLKACIKNLYSLDGVVELNDYSNIILLPEGECFESYLLNEGYKKEIKIALNKVENCDDFLKEYIKDMHGQKRKKGLLRDYRSTGGKDRALNDILLSSKAKYAPAIANAIVDESIKKRKIPRKIKTLFDTMNLK